MELGYSSDITRTHSLSGSWVPYFSSSNSSLPVGTLSTLHGNNAICSSHPADTSHWLIPEPLAKKVECSG